MASFFTLFVVPIIRPHYYCYLFVWHRPLILCSLVRQYVCWIFTEVIHSLITLIKDLTAGMRIILPTFQAQYCP